MRRRHGYDGDRGTPHACWAIWALMACRSGRTRSALRARRARSSRRSNQVRVRVIFCSGASLDDSYRLSMIASESTLGRDPVSAVDGRGPMGEGGCMELERLCSFDGLGGFADGASEERLLKGIVHDMRLLRPRSAG